MQNIDGSLSYQVLLGHRASLFSGKNTVSALQYEEHLCKVKIIEYRKKVLPSTRESQKVSVGFSSFGILFL